MAKQSATKIADHLTMDVEDVKESRYQPSYFDRPVYSIGDKYWAAGSRPPMSTRFECEWFKWTDWKKLISSYDGVTILWYIDADLE